MPGTAFPYIVDTLSINPSWIFSKRFSCFYGYPNMRLSWYNISITHHLIFSLPLIDLGKERVPDWGNKYNAWTIEDAHTIGMSFFRWSHSLEIRAERIRVGSFFYSQKGGNSNGSK
jgi:hypothetical protein